MTNGQATCIEELTRSASPRAVPRISIAVQQNRTTVTTLAATAEVRIPTAPSAGESRRATRTGQMAMVTAPIPVQTTWAVLLPCAGWGKDATPNAATPATTKPTRAAVPTAVNP